MRRLVNDLGPCADELTEARLSRDGRQRLRTRFSSCACRLQRNKRLLRDLGWAICLSLAAATDIPLLDMASH
jgi:hypothetical protein